jgi:hypothetical protein
MAVSHGQAIQTSCACMHKMQIILMACTTVVTSQKDMLQCEAAGKQMMSPFSSLSLKVTTFFGILKIVLEHQVASKQTLLARNKRVLLKRCSDHGH